MAVNSGASCNSTTKACSIRGRTCSRPREEPPESEWKLASAMPSMDDEVKTFETSPTRSREIDEEPGVLDQPRSWSDLWHMHLGQCLNL